MKEIKLKLGLLLLVATLLACEETGFSEDDKQALAAEEEQHCVDEKGNYVDDKECMTPDAGGWDPQIVSVDGGSTQPVHQPGQTVVVYPHYHYVYVPRSYYLGLGHPAEGFVTATSPGSGAAFVSSGKAVSAAPSAHSSFVARGGFGSSGHAGSSTSGVSAARGGFGGSAAGHAGGSSGG